MQTVQLLKVQLKQFGNVVLHCWQRLVVFKYNPEEQEVHALEFWQLKQFRLHI
jgi:hypothetical protein